MSTDRDVLIIGAGLAGATAAETLSAHGLNVAILEARDRVGGRAYTRNFAATGEALDFGGAWITPWQHRIRKLCTRHGIPLRPRHPVTARRWYRGGALHHDGPVSPQDGAAHESALARIAAHAALLKAGITTDRHGFDIAGKSLASYLDAINAVEATRDLVSAWWTASGNGDKTRVPASEFLHSVAYGDGTPDGMCMVWADTLAGGVQTLTEKMIAASAATLIADAALTRIVHGPAGITVTLADGRIMTARCAILATGLNPLAHIAFDPPLDGLKAESQRQGHLGRAVKIWARLKGVPVGILATGGGTGIEWMFTERETADGAVLAVGFGVAANGYLPEMPKDIEIAIARFFPEARLLAWDWHDWNADPFSRGAWVASILGRADLHAAETWSSTGPLAFASSDIARAEAGWFEAAIISGADAAQAVLAQLKCK